MTTNGRNKVILEEGDSHYYGQAVLDKSTMTNIVSMSNAIKKGFRIFFDSSKENCFYVIDWKERNIHYPYHKKGLYVQEVGTHVDCSMYGHAIMIKE